jgi:enolase-phosphatase E1
VPVSLPALHTRALVLDVEGTTTPVEFVYQVLFPFARTHAAEYLEREAASPACRAAIEQLREELASDPLFGRKADETQGPAGASPILSYAFWLMDRDRKSPALKTLQGLIWQDGFRSGELRGQVYADVPPAFERWTASGRDIYIYSSGSALAQRLLFESTDAGDLTRFLAGHFDTSIGPKADADSYRAIAARAGAPSSALLFVSDVIAELDAARAAGLNTVLCVRDQIPETGNSGHPIVATFDEITV